MLEIEGRLRLMKARHILWFGLRAYTVRKVE